MHGWNMTPWEFQVYSMNGSDFRGKTVGPVCFETVGIAYNWEILSGMVILARFD